MRLLVTGDRHWRDWREVWRVLDEERNAAIASGDHEFVLIEGEAQGVDRMSREWAEERGVPYLPYQADWRVTEETPPWAVRYRADGSAYDASAGGRRNQRMIDEGQPDRAVAVHKNLGISKGTKDCVQRLERHHVPTRFVPYDTRWSAQMTLGAA
jgi:hypothetical protein